MNRRYVECVLPETDGRFHYHLPSEVLDKNLEPGARLLVPFGKGLKLAFFIQTIKTPDVAVTKAVISVLDKHSLIQAKLFQLLLWISSYYFTPLGALIKTALPKGIHVVPKRQFHLSHAGLLQKKGTRSPIQLAIVDLLQDKGALAEGEIRKTLHHKNIASALSALKRKGMIQDRWEVDPPRVRPKYERYLVLEEKPEAVSAIIEKLQKTAPKQADVLIQLLDRKGTVKASEIQLGAHKAAARRLVLKGILKQVALPVTRKPEGGNRMRSDKVIVLNQDQSAAVDGIEEALLKGKFSPFLLHGVTGSGKTEVYLRAIELAARQGKGSILLLPEIALTSQIAARFYARFGERMALLHSGLSSGERYDEWRRVKEGKVDLVIGARSAIFAPFRSLGAIIVDEEHDPSYRQEEGSRYHARDVALVRGRDEDAVVILGSATPSFESYYNSQVGKYRYLHLPKRIEARPLPPVHLVDLREKSEWARPFFSKTVVSAIKKRLGAKEQVLLFVNRRGYAPFLLCRDCGHVPTCIRCSVSLTYHKEIKRLTCHYCGFSQMSPTVCPECHGVEIHCLGIGTEQIEESIRTLFPKAKVARLDRDTVQKKGSHAKILSAMEREETDILIGTQMIAKGHDFPKVTLVGVISADLSLHLTDFRSEERTFQLLTQVAGRAGRGEQPGEVFFQTFHPEEKSIRAAMTHDYIDFYNQGILSRKERNYPPFSRIVLLRLKCQNEERLVSAAESLAGILKQSRGLKGIELLGPIPAPLLRLHQTFRYQMLLKGPNQQRIASVLRLALGPWRNSVKGGVQLDIEIDPQQFV